MMRDMTCYFSQDNGAKIGSILLRMDAMASMGGVIGQGRRNWVGEGHFVRSVNLIPTGGQFMPTTLLLTPRIFRPFYGPVISVLDSRIMSLDSDPCSQHFVSLCQLPYVSSSKCSRTVMHTGPILKKPTQILNYFSYQGPRR